MHNKLEKNRLVFFRHELPTFLSGHILTVADGRPVYTSAKITSNSRERDFQVEWGVNVPNVPSASSRRNANEIHQHFLNAKHTHSA